MTAKTKANNRGKSERHKNTYADHGADFLQNEGETGEGKEKKKRMKVKIKGLREEKKIRQCDMLHRGIDLNEIPRWAYVGSLVRRPKFVLCAGQDAFLDQNLVTGQGKSVS